MPTQYSAVQLRTALAQQAFQGQHPIDIDTTSLGTTTTAIIADLAFGTSGASTNAYHGIWLYIAETVASGPTLGETSKVLATGGFAPATGTLTVAPAFSAAVQSGTDLLFYYENESPAFHLQSINRVLRSLVSPSYVPLTLVTDGTMEATGTTDWAASSATLSKVTTAANVPYGPRSLRVLATGSVGYAQSADFRVTEGEPLIVSALVRADLGTARLNLIDVTNSNASVKTADTNEELFTEIRFTQDVPADSEEMNLRLTSVANTDDSYWAAVGVLSTSRRRFLLPSAIERAEDILDVLELPQAYSSESADTFLGMTERFRSVPYDLETDDTAPNQMWLVLHKYPRYPMWIHFNRRFTELTAETGAGSTTYADRDLLVAGAMYYIEMSRAARFAASNPELASAHRAEARRWNLIFQGRLGRSPIRVVEKPAERILIV